MAKKEEKKVLERKLPEDVAKKYNCKVIRPGKFDFKGFGEIDLRTISVPQADKLVEKGFPYLELKEDAKADQEAKEAEKLQKIETAKNDLKELDLTDIEKFDYNKAQSIASILEVKTDNRKKETLFEALKKLQAPQE